MERHLTFYFGDHSKAIMDFQTGKLYRVKQNVFHSEGSSVILWRGSIAMCVGHEYFKKRVHSRKQWHRLFLNKNGQVVVISWTDKQLDTLFEGPL